MELDRSDEVSYFNKIAQIVDTFFSSIYKKIVENNLQLNKHVIIEDIDGVIAPQHMYVNEFVEFFDLQNNLDFSVGAS